MAMIWHPDHCAEEAAADIFIRIKTAYDVLKDPDTRAVRSRAGIPGITENLNPYYRDGIAPLVRYSIEGSKNSMIIRSSGRIVDGQGIDLSWPVQNVEEWLKADNNEFAMIKDLRELREIRDAAKDLDPKADYERYTDYRWKKRTLKLSIRLKQVSKTQPPSKPPG